MNKVTGKITLTKSNIGIPNLLVVIYDIDPSTKSQDLISKLNVDGKLTTSMPIVIIDAFSNPTKPVTDGLGDRIGSVLTDENGNFSIEYDDEEFRIRNTEEQRPDLLLLVYAPEISGMANNANLLFVSHEIRQNAGRVEMYIVQLTEDQLKKAGVEIPVNQVSTAPITVDSRIATYKSRVNEESQFNKEIEQFEREKNVILQTQIDTIKKNIKEQLLPKTLPSDKGFTTFVAENENVGQRFWQDHLTKELGKANTAIANKVVSNLGLEVTFLLNLRDRGLLDINLKAAGNKALTKKQLESIRSKMNAAGAENLVLTSNNPILKKCLKKNDDVVCAEEHAGLTSAHTNEDSKDDDPLNKDEVDTITKPEDIAKYVNKVLTELRLKNAPDKTEMKRPDGKTVDDSVNKFSLKKGPAELPSFYDFNVLQIAFGHVWQYLLDENVANIASNAGQLALNRGWVNDPSRIIDFIKKNNSIQNHVFSEPPSSVVSVFDITYYEWNALNPEFQDQIKSYAFNIRVWESVNDSDALRSAKDYRNKGEMIIEYIRNNNISSFHAILQELEQILKSKYLFTIFGADETAKSVNFGLVNTYRQKWEPTAYQVGDLVKSIPLSAKEERKYSLKTTFTRKRSDKESRKNNTSLVQEQNTTSRAESEIVAKAQTKTDFNLNATYGSGAWNITSSFALDAQKESQENRKDFRESVLKAAQEFKEERSVEINTEESYSSEYTESGTITNPNDELAVTYLFYELQKRFKVSEQLYRVMPVVMIAQDVPAPNEITEAWIIANDWIINRTLLDDSFRPALQYIAQRNVGDDFAIRELRKNLRDQRQLIDTLKLELSMLRTDVDNRYAALENSINDRLSEEQNRERDSGLRNIFEWFGADKESPESAKARELAARDAHQIAVEKAEKLASSLQRETISLHQLTDDYNKTLRNHLDQKTMVSRLKTHIKNNIIYYMQAIWRMEPPDQRYMRLLDAQVPHLEFEELTCELQQIPVPVQDDLFNAFRQEGETLHKAWVQAKIKATKDANNKPITKDLVEVADLDRLLGFKGNYAIFPLKQHNALTELMAMPYVDAAFGAMDPDQLSNVSLEDYARYVCCLKDEMTDPEFEKIKPTLKKWLELLLADPLRNGDEIIVPTNSLYIEVMTSANTILEDFKLQHREWDVYKVQEEVRMQAMENLRYAKRILMDQLEQPRIEKKIVIEGGGNPIINPEV